MTKTTQRPLLSFSQSGETACVFIIIIVNGNHFSSLTCLSFPFTIFHLSEQSSCASTLFDFEELPWIVGLSTSSSLEKLPLISFTQRLWFSCSI